MTPTADTGERIPLDRTPEVLPVAAENARGPDPTVEPHDLRSRLQGLNPALVVTQLLWGADDPAGAAEALLAFVDPALVSRHVAMVLEERRARAARREAQEEGRRAVERKDEEIDARIAADEARWSAWLAEHAGGLAAVELPMPRARAGRPVYVVVTSCGMVAASAPTREGAWRRAVDLARTRDPDIVEDLPESPLAWVRDWTNDYQIVRVTGPSRHVAAFVRETSR